jgi:uncharacterized protein (DUF305 family)
MKMRDFRAVAGAVLVGIGVLALQPNVLIGQTDSGAMSGMGSMRMSVSVGPIPPGSDYTAADVAFMQGMVVHHGQALRMAAMASTHGAGRDVSIVCHKILISQNDDITFMDTWLADRHQPAPDPKDLNPMMMPGMLTPAQMAQLDSARGPAFDRLFLTGMIQHHSGALMMVKDLFAVPGAGQAPEMFRFASDVDADQRAEIARMQGMLNSLKGGSTE